MDVHPFIVFYDKDAAAKAGLLDPKGELAPMGSPKALLDAGKALADVTGKSGILFGHVTDTAQSWRQFAALYAQTGAAFTLPDGGPAEIDTDAAVRVVSFMQQLFDGRTNPNNLDYNSALAGFVGGRGGMAMLGEWELPTLQKSGIKLGAAPFPQVFDRPAVYTDSHSFVLPHQDSPDPARRREAHRYVAQILKQSLTWASAGHIPAYQPVLAEPAVRGAEAAGLLRRRREGGGPRSAELVRRCGVELPEPHVPAAPVGAAGQHLRREGRTADGP